MENTIMYLKKHKFEVFVYLSNNVGENKIGRKLVILQGFKESRNIEGGITKAPTSKSRVMEKTIILKRNLHRVHLTSKLLQNFAFLIYTSQDRTLLIPETYFNLDDAMRQSRINAKRSLYKFPVIPNYNSNMALRLLLLQSSVSAIKEIRRHQQF